MYTYASEMTLGSFLFTAGYETTTSELYSLSRVLAAQIKWYAALYACFTGDYMCIRVYFFNSIEDHSVIVSYYSHYVPQSFAVTSTHIPSQISPSSPRTRIKRIYALAARVSAAQCADRVFLLHPMLVTMP